jgi:predicted nucleic acid-binding Zn ribbon protein
MPLEPIRNPLDSLLEKLGVRATLRGWDALRLWADVVGEPAASRSRAVAFEGGRLIVEVDGPAWSAQLSYLKRDICERLNRRLGAGVVREIQFTPARGGAR